MADQQSNPNPLITAFATGAGFALGMFVFKAWLEKARKRNPSKRWRKQR